MPVQAEIEAVFRREHGAIMASLVRAAGGDFDAAEDAVQEAFALALERWPVEGIPAKPGAWLTTAARNKAIDRARRDRAFAKKAPALAALAAAERAVTEDEELPDDRLRLIFTCCHPAIDLESRVALTLRTLGGLTTPEVARAFLVPEAAMAQRLVRVKRKIKDAGIPYVVPPREVLAERLEAVLAVVYLVFNEGYSATAGAEHVRRDLCREALRLGALVVELLPEGEALGLLALMTLHDARRAARTSPEGELILLEEQDRSLWDRAAIARGTALLERALTIKPAGPYVIQAAIAALHVAAARAADTDWAQIALLYRELAKRVEGPVVALNHAVAVAMADGPEAGLARLATLEDALEGYHLFHAARADLLRRLGRSGDAAASYRAALALTANLAEKRFLERRLASL